MTDTAAAYPFLNPLTDFGFKYLFSAEANKNILISFLNAVFRGTKKIINLNYGATESAGNRKIFKKVYFDITCTTNDGERFIIEMQQEKQEHFRDRCVFYLSRSINQQAAIGKKWRQPLQTIYVIALLNFGLTDSEPGSYLQDIALTNKDTGKLFYPKLGFKFIELPRFNKNEEDLETDLDKWIYTLKNMNKLTQIPRSFQEGVFLEVFQLAELNKMSEIDRIIYESNLKSDSDYENTIRFAAKKAAIKAKKAGIAKGIAEEKAKWKIREIKNKLFITHNLEQLGFSADQIFEITSLPFPEIKALE